ncbi:MAG: hypothetical protein JNK53_01755, partial [Phycisphaerae bacterium]|nr:hypothetical protein [Phycisphaerae bacterium]
MPGFPMLAPVTALTFLGITWAAAPAANPMTIISGMPAQKLETILGANHNHSEWRLRGGGAACVCGAAALFVAVSALADPPRYRIKVLPPSAGADADTTATFAEAVVAGTLVAGTQREESQSKAPDTRAIAWSPVDFGVLDAGVTSVFSNGTSGSLAVVSDVSESGWIVGWRRVTTGSSYIDSPYAWSLATGSGVNPFGDDSLTGGITSITNTPDRIAGVLAPTDCTVPQYVGFAADLTSSGAVANQCTLTPDSDQRALPQDLVNGEEDAVFVVGFTDSCSGCANSNGLSQFKPRMWDGALSNGPIAADLIVSTWDGGGMVFAVLSDHTAVGTKFGSSASRTARIWWPNDTELNIGTIGAAGAGPGSVALEGVWSDCDGLVIVGDSARYMPPGDLFCAYPSEEAYAWFLDSSGSGDCYRIEGFVSPLSPWTIVSARGVNAKSTIVGHGAYYDVGASISRTRGFIATRDYCPADLNEDGAVGGADLGALLAAWGCSSPCAAYDADLNRDGSIGGADLGLL